MSKSNDKELKFEETDHSEELKFKSEKSKFPLTAEESKTKLGISRSQLYVFMGAMFLIIDGLTITRITNVFAKIVGYLSLIMGVYLFLTIFLNELLSSQKIKLPYLWIILIGIGLVISILSPIASNNTTVPIGTSTITGGYIFIRGGILVFFGGIILLFKSLKLSFLSEKQLLFLFATVFAIIEFIQIAISNSWFTLILLVLIFIPSVIYTFISKFQNGKWTYLVTMLWFIGLWPSVTWLLLLAVLLADLTE